MLNRLSFLLICFLSANTLFAINPKNVGNLNNLVCFVHFSDEDNYMMFDKTFSSYQKLFNDENENANSVINYFHQASYGQLTWKSSFFPTPNGDQVLSYQAQNERGYYKEKNSINPYGYENELEKAAREQALIREVAEYLSKNLPDDINLDGNNDNLIDNICFIISGGSEFGARHLLWPHRTDLALPDEKAIYIKGKKMVGYLFVFNDANGFDFIEGIPLNTGVLCHEMSHSLGTYDLYHVNDDLNPVGVWDLMSNNQLVAQHMTVYTKWRYCGWIDEIPEISEPGRYTLHPVGGKSKENIAYKIKPIGSDEYFVVEYRKKEGLFDKSLPESGLLVYRINPNLMGGNLNYNGTTRLDEQYIFRPGGTTKLDGTIEKAAFSAESKRTAFGGTAEMKPFYSNGEEAHFAIANISTCGETISFDLLEQKAQIYLPVSKITLAGTADSKMEVNVSADVDWEIKAIPEWITVEPMQGKAGKAVITVTTKSENKEAKPREAVLTLKGVSDPATADLTIIQSSNLIQPPTKLAAKANGNQVELTWIAPQEGSAILADGFEDVNNPNQWEIKNAGDRGWILQENKRNNEAYKGNYSMRLRDAWVDAHQDERLTSPTFANGKTLSFYSRSIAPGKVNNLHNFYFVEVSKDNGKTWEQIYDLKADCDVINKYTKIDIDLAAYQSETMKISFHAYDDNNMGLSYWWHIDEVSIFPEVKESIITHYVIYRNGKEIGTSKTCTFVDEHPLSGENVYTVRAVGSFGETPDSNETKITMEGSGIEEATINLVQAHVENGVLYIQAEEMLNKAEIYSTQGVCVMQQTLQSQSAQLAVNHLPQGIYLVKCYLNNMHKPQLIKVVINR